MFGDRHFHRHASERTPGAGRSGLRMSGIRESGIRGIGIIGNGVRGAWIAGARILGARVLGVRLRRLGVVALLAGMSAVATAHAETAPERGDAAARLPEGSFASESWDVVARFESGHLLLATMALFDPGLGTRNAVAFGQLVEPDGTTHPFSRSERAGGWQLDPTRRRVDLRSIVLDLTAPARRFVVDKNELGIEVVVETGGAPAWPDDEPAAGCALDVIEVAGAAHGSFRIERGPAVPLRGFAAITHRWMPGLEAGCLRRGLELFAMQDGLGLYLRDVETATGERRSWLVVHRDGAVVFRGPATASEILWSAGLPGYPEPSRLQFRAPGLTGRVAFGASVGRFEPLSRLPLPLRIVMEQRTRPRLVWSPADLELMLDGAPNRWIRSPALARLSWTNPATGGIEALPAAGDPVPEGE
ncbi:hypothetical protein KJ059_05810 [Myxococcota bacterium]|nr:hypothetical protein [Myxococcota bacterium]